MFISCFLDRSIAAKLFENKSVENPVTRPTTVNPLYTEAKRFYLMESLNPNTQGGSN